MSINRRSTMPLATLSRPPRCRRPSIRGVTAVLAPLAALAIAAPAQAAIPGPVPVPPGPPPYGERIAVEMDGRIMTMHPDGTDVRPATNPPDGVSDSAPDISADSKQVVFVRTAGGNDDVYVVNVDGSNARRLTSTYLYRSEENTPDHQPH